MATREYERKRDFRRSPEPRPRRGRKRSRKPGFAIQQHAASSMHFDLRLESESVLKSWAVPKGPSTDPREKRLAMPTEDHPLDYLDFEGVIPEGQYGAGVVIVWDRGTYENLSEDEEGEPLSVSEALERGRLRVRLDGEKLSGAWALVRIAEGREERWLFIKERDRDADARRTPVRTEPESVISGKTVTQMGEGEE